LCKRCGKKRRITFVDRERSTLFNSLMALTNNDLKLIKSVMKVTVDEELDVKLEEKLNEKIGRLPTKDDFFGKMDEVMAELKIIREEQPLQSHHLSDHEDRIEKIENKLQIKPSVMI